jgi:hypothetical protein
LITPSSVRESLRKLLRDLLHEGHRKVAAYQRQCAEKVVARWVGQLLHCDLALCITWKDQGTSGVEEEFKTQLKVCLGLRGV